ncbi:MAG: type II toxin-antitoxin system HicA family toxin [Rhodospirillales bacterium]|nr:type II toxin-antitoxin system HicA family toxin [Rhodospirillales bacterium]
MARLRPLSGREVCRVLESHGFAEIRRRGSHIVMQRMHEGRTTTVPVPDHRELRTGTLMSIIRQSGLRRTDFE